MASELTAAGAAVPEQIPPAEQADDMARVAVFGGLEAGAGVFSAGEELRARIQAQDLRLSALHQADESAVAWLSGAGIDIISLASLESGIAAPPVLPQQMHTLGLGETEASANRPLVLCINGIRLGFVCFAEQPAGEGDTRADLMSLMAFDRVRMLFNQCDHVIVLIKSGLSEAELPLPEWRARYRRFIEAGASVVADTGCTRGWESHQNGLIFYGLGSPVGSDSLCVFLSLRRNGKLDYEARALQLAAGQLDFSGNDSFKTGIDAQNRLLTDEKAYQSAADRMCRRIYCESGFAQKRGVLGLFTPHADEEAKLLSLLENESLRLIALRAIRLQKAENGGVRENAKKA